MPETEYKRGSPEEVNREYLREKAKEHRGGTSQTVEPGAVTKILQERYSEGYPLGFSLGVTHGRQAVQLLLTDKDNPETTVIAQISINEIREYLRDKMEKQLAEAERMIRQASDLLRELDKGANDAT